VALDTSTDSCLSGLIAGGNEIVIDQNQRAFMTISPRDPLVVIVTPVYNGADFLEETMECVQAQTYQNLVHCVLDNASTDATPEIIAHFAGRRVPLITARNTTTIPVIENWNAALTLVPPATGYFRILSADDKIAPSYIAKMVALGEQNLEIGVFACHERLNTSLIGADLPTDQTVFDGRAIVRRSLLQKLRFPYDHCLYRHPSTGIPKSFFDTDYCGTQLLCADTDAAMRLVSRTGCAVVHEPLGTTRWPGAVTAAQMLPNKTGIWSILQLIDRWGPSVFDTESEYLYCRNRHLRNYYLHLLLWRVQGNAKLVKLHHDWLRRASASPKVLDYVHSLAEWPYLRTMEWFHSVEPSGQLR
jgi:Glycosyl transferase family 2